MPCESLTSCDTCRLNTSCGWCRSSKKCLPGDLDGPTNEGCLSWYYQECPGSLGIEFSLNFLDIGMEFWAYFFTAIAVLLMLVNMFSIFTEDKDATSQMSDNKIKASWWRNQRSGSKFRGIFSPHSQVLGHDGSDSICGHMRNFRRQIPVFVPKLCFCIPMVSHWISTSMVVISIVTFFLTISGLLERMQTQ